LLRAFQLPANKRIRRRIMENNEVLVEISARHVHVTKEDLEVLFGAGYALTVKKELSQPGQFASNEKIRVVGTKGEFPAVSIIGPCRNATQDEPGPCKKATAGELSFTDAPFHRCGCTRS